MKAAMNEDSKTSCTPYLFVVSIRSRENAIPGKMLCQSFISRGEGGGVNILCEKSENCSREDSIIPCICPVREVESCSGFDVVYDALSWYRIEPTQSTG